MGLIATHLDRELNNDDIFKAREEMYDAFEESQPPPQLNNHLLNHHMMNHHQLNISHPYLTKLNRNHPNQRSSKPYDNYMPITEMVLAKNLQGFSEILYAQVAEDNWKKHKEAVASYADLKMEIAGFHDATF
ncbi:hypothetical protein Tco_0156705 [Tanacetum coccineum]